MKKRLLFFHFLSVISISLCHAQTPTLWGITWEGGANHYGVIVNYSTSTGKETDVYNFAGGADGAYPYGSLIMANNGLLYGMTEMGGTYDSGTIFSYNILTGTEAVIYNFGGETDGAYPEDSLMQANNGLLYGMTFSGGYNDNGIIFSYNITTGKETDLHDFGNDNDASAPAYGALIQATNGLLYGLTAGGGYPYWDGGALFSYNITTGKETVLYDFGGDTSIVNPEGSLVQANNGLLYGTTLSGGSDEDGNIFSYDIATGIETDIYDFTLNKSYSGAYWPDGSLIEATNGLLYGSSPTFVNALGGIFSYNILTGAENSVYTFQNDTALGEWGPSGTPLQASNELLYGMTTWGGTYDSGIIYSYNISTGKEYNLYNFNDQNGMAPAWGNSLIEDDTVNIFPWNATICEGNSIMLTTIGVSSYIWSPAIGLSATTGDTVIVNPTATTTYTIEGKFGIQTIKKTVTVIVNPNPTISVTIPPIVCSGENTILTASGGTIYYWTPSTGLSATTGDTVIANLTSTITYIVTGTDSLGCTAKDTAVVLVTASPNKPTITRQGDVLTSSATQGNQWERNDTIIQGATNKTFTATQVGCYSVTASNPANGCSATSDTVCIISAGIPQLSITNYFSLYPNPSDGEINIVSSINMDELKVFNLLGQLIFEAQPKQTQLTFELMEEGIYFVTITSDNETITKQVAVLK